MFSLKQIIQSSTHVFTVNHQLIRRVVYRSIYMWVANWGAGSTKEQRQEEREKAEGGGKRIQKWWSNELRARNEKKGSIWFKLNIKNKQTKQKSSQICHVWSAEKLRIPFEKTTWKLTTIIVPNSLHVWLESMKVPQSAIAFFWSTKEQQKLKNKEKEAKENSLDRLWPAYWFTMLCLETTANKQIINIGCWLQRNNHIIRFTCACVASMNVSTYFMLNYSRRENIKITHN